MIKIAVCDDEQQYLDNAVSLLEVYAAEEGLDFAIKTVSSASALLESIRNGASYDIYFLDIYMPGIDGISVATEIRSRKLLNPIVFLTSSREHAVEAFGVGAVHYLLKPYGKEAFFAAIRKALQHLERNFPKVLMLKTTAGYQHIAVEKIVYCESDDNYQRIWMRDGSTVYVRITAVDLFERLSPFESFYHCGRSMIINLGQIRALKSGGVVMKDGKNLAVPKRVMPGLKNAYFDYHFQETT